MMIHTNEIQKILENVIKAYSQKTQMFKEINTFLKNAMFLN